jgi:hypothetical protein
MNTDISPGMLYVLWETIRLLLRYTQVRDLLVNVTSTLFNIKYSIGDKNLITSSIEFGCKLNLLSQESVFIGLTEKAVIEYKDTNNITLFIRKLLKDYLILEKPLWLNFFDEDSKVFSDYIPAKWIDLLNAGDLLDFEHLAVINWWDDIVTKVEVDDDKFRKEVGNFGEELTIKYEMTRLANEQIYDFEKNIHWMAKISDKYGYDVASLSGSLNNAIPKGPIMIEVKATQSSNQDRVRFFVTRNEWTTAINNSDSYYFYIWLGVDLFHRSIKCGPKVIPAAKILNMFPIDQNQNIHWELSQVVLNLASFF